MSGFIFDATTTQNINQKTMKISVNPCEMFYFRKNKDKKHSILLADIYISQHSVIYIQNTKASQRQ